VASLTPEHRAAERVRLIAEALARVAMASGSHPPLRAVARSAATFTTTVTTSINPDPRGQAAEPPVCQRSLI